MRPLILDTDGSVPAIDGATVVPLGDLQEQIRFGCTMGQLKNLRERLAPPLRTPPEVAFLGSGDFHHLSYLLIERIARDRPIEVVVLDNHPDNMRYPFGVHCGSWVRRVTQLPQVRHVHVVGITSSDVSAKRLWENYLTPLRRGQLTYWCIGSELRWPRWVPWHEALRSFGDADALLAAFKKHQAHSRAALYLSIDKDVLSPSVVRSNWDQGVFREETLHAIIELLGRRIVACDITGEVSSYHYLRAWKRWLAARDAQPQVEAGQLYAWRQQHCAVNDRLLAKLAHEMEQAGPAASANTAAMCSN
ncbi:MAG: hypothetical protein ABI885_02710 [Gammaproteobacteria bacterium]